MNDSSANWTRVASALRDTGVNTPLPADDLTPPPGFATRIVATARPADPDLTMWKRLSLAGAGAAAAAFAIAFLAFPAPDRTAQFLPVPALEFPANPTE